MAAVFIKFMVKKLRHRETHSPGSEGRLGSQGQESSSKGRAGNSSLGMGSCVLALCVRLGAATEQTHDVTHASGPVLVHNVEWVL